MSNPDNTSHIIFKGMDGNECEEFIGAIEDLAFTEGWSRDRERMLLFARSRLRNRALRWFARLDPAKKEDWNSFVEALFDQYPVVDEPSVESGLATPVWSATTFSPGTSAANLLPDSESSNPHHDLQRGNLVPRSSTYDASLTGLHTGVLRVVVDNGTATPRYVGRGVRYSATSLPDLDCLRSTTDRQEALVVSFIATSEPHSIGCLNSAFGLKLLALYYHSLNYYPYELCTSSSPAMLPEQNNSSYLSISVIWKIQSDGALEVSFAEWAYDSNAGSYTIQERFNSTDFYLNTSGDILFRKPGAPPPQNNSPSTGLYYPEIRARLVFEPI